MPTHLILLLASSRARSLINAFVRMGVFGPFLLEALDSSFFYAPLGNELLLFALIHKGGGGALLREKLVAAASARMIVVADMGKRVETLGRFPLPVEVVPFAWEVTARRVAGVVGVEPVVRRAGADPYLTDNGNYILDCGCGTIEDPPRTERELKLLPGVVECGLFVGMAEVAILAGDDGELEILERRA